ncbi:MAG: hypothetical protein DRJ31_07185 [Candidatus Methanomethylicota archaeon]|uniref:Uncharacterized protein n=1 Tax=Thermoproteota archaeon TaxID=2056631 RepID=A0A497EMP5_9CREN|nr:MAG: hypothetical protein DRJ31_07185 [Candidatus Verstraetearchaeota archaeon]RLE53045.1 MAG: hypothetical protein DRJ33_02115 [Candidatus Verstraetearchaeota archaeon]
MRSGAIWRPEPIELIIVDILRRKAGSARDRELYEAVKKVVRDLSYRDFNRALMKLELNGIVNTSTIKKTIKNVVLVEKAKE